MSERDKKEEIKTDHRIEQYKKIREEADAKAKSHMLEELNRWMRARDYHAQ